MAFTTATAPPAHAAAATGRRPAPRAAHRRWNQAETTLSKANVEPAPAQVVERAPRREGAATAALCRPRRSSQTAECSPVRRRHLRHRLQHTPTGLRPRHRPAPVAASPGRSNLGRAGRGRRRLLVTTRPRFGPSDPRTARRCGRAPTAWAGRRAWRPRATLVALLPSSESRLDDRIVFLRAAGRVVAQLLQRWRRRCDRHGGADRSKTARPTSSVRRRHRTAVLVAHVPRRSRCRPRSVPGWKKPQDVFWSGDAGRHQ